MVKHVALNHGNGDRYPDEPPSLRMGGQYLKEAHNLLKVGATPTFRIQNLAGDRLADKTLAEEAGDMGSNPILLQVV